MHATASRAGTLSFLVPAGIHGFCPELPHGEVPRGAPAEELLSLRDRRTGRKATAARRALLQPWVASLLLHGAMLGWAVVLSHITCRRQIVRASPPTEPVCVVWAAPMLSVPTTHAPVFAIVETEASSEPWPGLKIEDTAEPASAVHELADVRLPVSLFPGGGPSTEASTPEPAACFDAGKFRNLKPTLTSFIGVGSGAHATNSGGGSGEGSGAGVGSKSQGSGLGTGQGSGHGNGTGDGYGSGAGRGALQGTGGEGTGRGSGRSRAARPQRGNPAPDYPKAAREQSQSGTVLIWIEVLADGRAGCVRIAESSGFPLLDAAALDVARKWKFKPAESQGQAVRSEVEVPFEFTMKRGR